MTQRIIFFLKYYLPVIIFAGVIFFFSSVPNLQVGLQSTTEAIILRKGAHFVEYAILAILLWRVFYVGYKFQTRYAFFWVFILASLYGASDEFHQIFVAGRTGKVIDAFYDAGSVLFTLEACVVIAHHKIKWKNILTLFLALFFLVGLELKMISETKSFAVSFSQMKTDLGYMVEHEIDFISKLKMKVDKNKNSQNENNDTIKSKNLSTQIKEKISQVPSVTEESINPKSQEVAEVPLPEKISIKVLFTSQAPLLKWDALHEEACEEASLVMLEYYSNGKTLTPAIAEKEIQALVAFQIKNYGDYKDTDVAQTLKLAEDFYHLKNLRVVYDFSADDLKMQLAKGKPILVPSAGRLLKNPFFTPPGPLYHNLILTGYDGDKIITNDPGTRRGESYVYDIDVLYKAIHDFPGDAKNIEQGRKAMIVME